MSTAWKQRVGIPVVALATVLLLSLFLPPVGRVVAQSSPPVQAAQTKATVAGASTARPAAQSSKGNLPKTGAGVVVLTLAGLFLVRLGILVRRLAEE